MSAKWLIRNGRSGRRDDFGLGGVAEALTAAVDAFPVGAAPDWLIPDEIEHLPMLVKACRFGLTWALSSDLGADEGDEDDDDDLESGVRHADRTGHPDNLTNGVLQTMVETQAEVHRLKAELAARQ
jgi:hypothetical protein